MSIPARNRPRALAAAARRARRARPTSPRVRRKRPADARAGVAVAAEEQPVPQHDDERRGDHDFLGRHAAGTDRDRGGTPPPPARGIAGGANRAVERREVAEPHQRLDALHDVSHRFGVERVDGPQERNRGRCGGRDGAEAVAQRGRDQRAPHDAEERERREQVDDQIERVVPHTLRANCVAASGGSPGPAGASASRTSAGASA